MEREGAATGTLLLIRRDLQLLTSSLLPSHAQAMIGFTRETPKFVRFVNMLINDSIFSMDEALTKLATIRTVQVKR